jgi:hypothetical protein
MKFLGRFVIPNKSANTIGIDLTKSYPLDVMTNMDFSKEFVIISGYDFERPFLLEVIDRQFLEDRFVMRGWFNYNYISQEPYLFKGAIEFRPVL